MNEAISFRFTLDDEEKTLPESLRIQWTRKGDDNVIQTGTIPLTRDTSATLVTSLAKPGFVYVYAALQYQDGRAVNRTDGKPVMFHGGAGVAPEQIPSSPEPGDFDEFWAKQKSTLAAVPMTAQVRELDVVERAVIYTARVSCAGPRPATAYMAIPIAAPRKSCDIRLHFDGYGFDLPKYQNQLKDSPGDAIHLYVNAHGAELMREQDYYLKLNAEIKSNGQMYAFDPEQNQKPENCYFLGMVWRILRIIEFARTIPEWNGKNLICEGISQGGLQTVWAAALSPYVTEAHPSIPWNCDVAGTERFQRLFGNWRIPYAPGLEYFDCVNMARRIKCPVTIERAGLGDYICPPSGVFLLYQAIKATKSIRWYQGATHSNLPRFPESFLFSEKKG